MKLSLSTNWCNRGPVSGEEIADRALSLGFDELELGFNTTIDQVAGFKARLDSIPVGSVHAFCPVPLSAPHGYPELYALASFDEDARGLARFHVRKNIAFAAEMGADTVVLHAGRVPFNTLFRRGFGTPDLTETLKNADDKLSDAGYLKKLNRARKVRRQRGRKMLDVFLKELDLLAPVLSRAQVTLALENLPYYEGFPDECETADLLAKFEGAPIKAWFDTGHHRVREMHGWLPEKNPLEGRFDLFAGMHLNDVNDYDDDHNAPGDGKVDFPALKDLAHAVRHVVFEPKGHVREAQLKKGLAYIRSIW